MSGTQVQFNRQTLVVEDAVWYEISSHCLLSGTLPDRYIFLLRISNPDDPKDDVLQRVVGVGDFDEYLTVRDDAIAQGDSLWRSDSFSIRYNDLVVANEGSAELISNVNALVEGYDTYLEDFQTPDVGEVVVFPTVDPATKTQLKNAYVASVTAVDEATTARDEAQEACTDISDNIATTQASIDVAQTDYDAIKADSASLTTTTAAVTSVQTSQTTISNQIRNLVASSSATVGEQGDINAQLNLLDAQISALATHVAQLDTSSTVVAQLVSDLQTRINTLVASQNTLVSDLNSCSTTAARAQADLDVAQTNQQSALANVLEVCPDYVPTV